MFTVHAAAELSSDSSVTAALTGCQVVVFMASLHRQRPVVLHLLLFSQPLLHLLPNMLPACLTEGADPGAVVGQVELSTLAQHRMEHKMCHFGPLHIFNLAIQYSVLSCSKDFISCEFSLMQQGKS